MYANTTDSGWLKDDSTGAVVATREAYDKWLKATQPRNDLIETKTRLANVEKYLEELESKIEAVQKSVEALSKAIIDILESKKQAA